MLIGEVAALSGLEPKTIRFYERAKLLAPRRHGRLRIYRTPELARLQLIKRLRLFDVPISKIRDLINHQDAFSLDGEINSFARELLGNHLQELESRHAKLQEHIRELNVMLAR